MITMMPCSQCHGAEKDDEYATQAGLLLGMLKSDRGTGMDALMI